jgi:phage-related protein
MNRLFQPSSPEKIVSLSGNFITLNKFFSVERFEVEFLPEAVEFMEELNDKAREKIYFNIRKAQMINDPELFKKLNDDIWEFRTLYNKTYYRLFAFWEKSGGKNTVVISTHGLIKKTARIPKSDLEKAARIRNEYLSQKKKRHDS